MKKLIISGLIMVLSVSLYSQTELRLNFLDEYQTIDGFGGYGAAREFFYGTTSGYPNWYSDAFVDYLVNDMGQTVIRVNMVGSFNYKEGTYDPDKRLANFTNNGANAIYNADYSNMKSDGSYLNSSIPFVKAMDAALRNNGDSLLLMLSLWSPPAWMKDNNDFMRGKLLPENYGKFADFIVNYIKTYEEAAGLKIYCISLQNEPNLGHPEWTLGCVYEGEEYMNMLNTVHARMEEEDVAHVRLIGPETVKFKYRMTNMMDPFIGDSASSSHVDMFCTHSYGGDGITIESASASEWRDLYDYTREIGEGNLWMTETGFTTEGWPGAMTDGRRIYGALKYGKVSSWIWWTNGAFRGMELGNITNSQLSYFSSKMFFRFIRPGAVHIGNSYENENLGIVSFIHHDRGEISIVMINSGTSTESVSLVNEGLPTEWNAWRSSYAERCVDLGVADISDIQLPANSITSLVSSGGQASPKIDRIKDLLIEKNTATLDIPLSGIEYGGGNGNPIMLTVSSSNTELIGTPVIDYSSPSSEGILHLNIEENKTGTAEIIIKVEDDPDSFFGSYTTSFTVRVIEINQPPTIDPVESFTVRLNEGRASKYLPGITDGNDGTQSISAQVITSDNHVLVASYSDDSLFYTPRSIGEVTLTLKLMDDGGTELGGKDSNEISFQVSVIDATGLADSEIPGKIHLFPVPADNHLKIQNLQPGSDIKIFSIGGKLLFSSDDSGKEMEINLVKYPPGLYFINIRHQETGSVFLKFIHE